MTWVLYKYEDGTEERKYIPDRCDMCGRFLTKEGECNNCGLVRCDGCGDMIEDWNCCEYCNPEEYLEDLKQDIESCQETNEVSSCDECDEKDDCYYRDEKKHIESRVSNKKEKSK